ncbi:MAG: glycosyltransferase [Aestuariivirgaceae bacterium]
MVRRPADQLRIVHVLRAPTGGLFRHVRDLARGQTEAGHAVGVVCGAAPVIAADDGLLRCCRLGIHPLPMSRLPAAGDLVTAQRTTRLLARLRPDIIHGHGAKGGLHARLAGRLLATPAVYTPHGGSLHYGWSSLQGMAYLGTERLLRGATSGLVFVCRYERDAFDASIGLGETPCRVVHNGLWPEEFLPIAPDCDAAELLFIGELRWLKGADVLIDAVALAAPRRRLRLAIVGSGPDEDRLRRQVRMRGLDNLVAFHGPLPVRQALQRGRLVVLPSRAESFPYAMLETMAAARPLIASRTGGIPELVPAGSLVTPGDARALLAAIEAALADSSSEASARSLAQTMAERFDAARMAEAVIGFYGVVLGRRRSLPDPVPK